MKQDQPKLFEGPNKDTLLLVKIELIEDMLVLKILETADQSVNGLPLLLDPK